MVDEAQLPPAVDALIGSLVRTIEELEVLLRLHADQRTHRAHELASALKLSEAATVAALQSLVLAKLVLQVGQSSPLEYLYSPEGEELKHAVDQLAEVYEENRFDIIMLISKRAIERVRLGVLKMFSDSFRFSGPKKDG